jgi:hypothetical protein
MLREGRIIFNGSDEELFISEDKKHPGISVTVMRILFSSPAPSLPVEPPETRFGILVMTAVEDGDARIYRLASEQNS